MKRILSCALIALLVLALVVLLLWDNQSDQKRAAELAQLQSETMPYVQEIAAIRQELKQRESEINVTSDVSGVIVSFVPTSREELTLVKEISAEYSLTPLVVLDCAMDDASVQEIAHRSLLEDLDLLLTGMHFDQTVLERADSVRSFLREGGYGKEPAFLLRNSFDTEKNLELLRQHGYRSLVRYSDSLAVGVDDFGVPYICYGFVRSSDASSGFISRIAAAHSNVLVLFSFEDLNSKTISPAMITETLEAIKMQEADGKLVYTTLEEAFISVAEAKSLSQKRREEFEQYKAKREKRIDELEEIISGINGSRSGG